MMNNILFKSITTCNKCVGIPDLSARSRFIFRSCHIVTFVATCKFSCSNQAEPTYQKWPLECKYVAVIRINAVAKMLPFECELEHQTLNNVLAQTQNM